MTAMRSPRRARFDSIGAIVRDYRGAESRPAFAEDLGVNEDSLRSLERRLRPLNGLARQLLRVIRPDLRQLRRDFWTSLDARIAEWPEEDQVIFIDACLAATERFVPGAEVRIRLNDESPARPVVAKVKVPSARSKRTAGDVRGSNSVGRVQPLPTSELPPPRSRGRFRPYVLTGGATEVAAAAG